MNLMRYEPWDTANTFGREIDRLFRGAVRQDGNDWVPAVDIREEEDKFVMHLDVPGVNPSDIEIAVEDSVLTLSGSRQSEQTEESDGYKLVERARGKFLRRFTLPDDIDPDTVSARSNNGVLEISIPKSPKSQPRRVEIAVN